MGWTGQDMPQALGLWCVYLLMFIFRIVNIPAFLEVLVVLICGNLSTSKFYQKNLDESVA